MLGILFLMEYQVPQFIEVEDKIFGPFTLKQFIYLAGGVGISVGLVLYLPFIFGVIIALPIAALAAALAFYKVNGKPFIDVIEAGMNYYVSRRLYLWRKEQPVAGAEEVRSTELSFGATPPVEKLGLSQGRLHDLALSLDSRTPPTR